jgi:hypothetical protein
MVGNVTENTSFEAMMAGRVAHHQYNTRWGQIARRVMESAETTTWYDGDDLAGIRNTWSKVRQPP